MISYAPKREQCDRDDMMRQIWSVVLAVEARSERRRAQVMSEELAMISSCLFPICGHVEPLVGDFGTKSQYFSHSFGSIYG